jgi:hypothetical protein
MNNESLAGHALSTRSKPKSAKAGKKQVHKMHITKAHGGFHIVHDHADPSAHPPEEHVAPDMETLQGHVAEHMGEPDGEGAQAAPDPAAAA